MLKKQILGIINLSMPLVVLYQFYPLAVVSLWGALGYSLLLGYVYLHDQKTRVLLKPGMNGHPY